MAVLERRVRDCRETSPFLAYAKNITSQGGEDGVIEELFRYLGVEVGSGGHKGFCVDIGAWDGKHWSNTYTLLNDRQWGGLLIEANPERADMLKALYSNRSDVTCCDRLVELSGPNALTSFLASEKVDPDFDFLTIDVDGADYHLWKSLGDDFRPRVVCIEFNPSIPNHIFFIQEDNIQVQQGSSLLALTELGRQLAPSCGGYQLVCTTTFNALFVRQDLMNRFPSTDCDFSLQSLHSEGMVTNIFQTYDGQLKLCGPQKLLWHRNSINKDKIQPLSKKHQIYPFSPQNNNNYAKVENLIDKMVMILSDSLNNEFANDVEINDIAENLKCTLSSLREYYEVSEGHNKGRSQISFLGTEALLVSVVISTGAMSLIHESTTKEILETIIFPHCVAVSDILINRGDKEALNDVSSAYFFYKQALHIIVVTALQDKHTSITYHQKFEEVISHLMNCVNTKKIEHLYENMFWIFFLKLISESSVLNGAIPCQSFSLSKSTNCWYSKLSSRLIAMGVDQKKLTKSINVYETDIYKGICNLRNSESEGTVFDEDLFSVFNRACARKSVKLLQGESDSNFEVARLRRENLALKVMSAVLFGFSIGICWFQPKFIFKK